jgi:hypothetical protein
MALIYVDGFDYNTGGPAVTYGRRMGAFTTDAGASWTWQSSLVNWPGPNSAALQFSPGSTGSIGYSTYSWASATTNLVFGFAFQYRGTLNTAGGNGVLARFISAGGSFNLADLGLSSSGHMVLVVYGGSGHPNLTYTGTATLTQGTWYYIELKYNVANPIATGDCAVHVNGISDIAVPSGVITSWPAASIASIQFGWLTGFSGYPTMSLTYDDLYLCDWSGSTNNTFLGSVRVQTLMPTTSGHQNDFTVASGAAYSDLATVPPSTNTSHRVTSPAITGSSNQTDIALFPVQSLVDSPATVYGLQFSATVLADSSVPSGKLLYFNEYTGSTTYTSSGVSLAQPIAEGSAENSPLTPYFAVECHGANISDGTSAYTTANIAAYQFGFSV